MRKDLLSFTIRCMRELQGNDPLDPNWHIELIAAKLSDIVCGRNRRLIINLPPRSLKSVLCSIVLPAWILGLSPRAQVICVSYAQPLADKFGRDCRQIMSSSWYQKLFPETKLAQHKHASADFETTRGGFRLATSTAGVLTGRGADYIIIDDPLKAEDAYSQVSRDRANDWYARTLVSRLNDKKIGAIVVVAQRLHEEDLSGTLLKQGGFDHVCLPAIAQEDKMIVISNLGKQKTVHIRRGSALHSSREPLSTLDDLRQSVGETVFASQYLQDPLPAEGKIIKSCWLQYYKKEQLPTRFDAIFQSWDTASKLLNQHDFSVCTTWGVSGTHLYLLHVLRDRMDFPTLSCTVIRHADQFDASTVLIEDKASGMPLLQELSSRGFNRARGVVPDGDKVMRMHGQTVLFENGVVRLPSEAPWLSEYVRELTAFPNAKHDDQVDSTSQALAWHNPRREEPELLKYYKKLNEQERLRWLDHDEKLDD